MSIPAPPAPPSGFMLCMVCKSPHSCFEAGCLLGQSGEIDGESTSIPHSITFAGYTFINPPYATEAVLMEGNRTVLTAKGVTAIHALAAIVSLAVQGEAAQERLDDVRESLRGLLGIQFKG